jgi:capsular polysaccharide transport system permease protein
MSAIYRPRASLGETLRSYSRVVLALMMRDVSTRFMGNAFGFLIAVGWPLSNIFLLLIINTVVGRPTPYGSSAALWFSTGLVPFMCFQYMSRFIVLGIVQNRAMLGYPIVKPMDVMIARAIVEVLNAGFVVLLAILILAWMKVDFMPPDPVQAFCAMGASMLLGLGFGVINGVIAGMFMPWAIGYGLFGIAMWAASGVLASPESLPEIAQYYLSFNPALQGVVWMRSAYYQGYGENILDKSYMVSFAVVSLVLGLLAERLLRARILA